jgi:hypothetical protein
MQDFTPEQLCSHAIGGLTVCADWLSSDFRVLLRVRSPISAPDQK